MVASSTESNVDARGVAEASVWSTADGRMASSFGLLNVLGRLGPCRGAGHNGFATSPVHVRARRSDSRDGKEGLPPAPRGAGLVSTWIGRLADPAGLASGQIGRPLEHLPLLGRRLRRRTRLGRRSPIIRAATDRRNGEHSSADPASDSSHCHASSLRESLCRAESERIATPPARRHPIPSWPRFLPSAMGLVAPSKKRSAVSQNTKTKRAFSDAQASPTPDTFRADSC
jgi:hypothetical protein